MTQTDLYNYLQAMEQQALANALASYTRKGTTYEYHNYMHEAAAYADAKQKVTLLKQTVTAIPLP